MTAQGLSRDPRLTLARPDMADEALRGDVEAERFATPEPRKVMWGVASLHRTPASPDGPDTQLLHGEEFRVLETKNGWAWGQSALDGYVGYMEAASLGPVGSAPTHRVRVQTGHAYGAPKLKTHAGDQLPFGVRVAVLEERDGYGRIGEGLWMPMAQLASLDMPEPDWVAVAERFLGAGYVWGGRSAWGLDCSALVQLARQAAGFDCPRDSDMQEQVLGDTVPDSEPLRRGDLVFWKGHVGIMSDTETLLHANAHYMAVTFEPLAAAIGRIDAAGDGLPTRRARLDVRAEST